MARKLTEADYERRVQQVLKAFLAKLAGPGVDQGCIPVPQGMVVLAQLAKLCDGDAERYVRALGALAP